MKRNLITQIKNEWRDNLWLIVELIVVSVAVWILTVFLCMALRTKFEEKGFDITDVYKIAVRTVPATSPEFIDNGDKTQANNLSDLRMLMQHIRKSPYVEVAAFSCGALPYSFNYSGNELHVIGSEDSVHYRGNIRIATPEIVRVIKPISIDNLPPSQLEKMLKDGGLLISPNQEYDRIRNTRDLLGEKVMLFDTVNPRTISALIYSIKRTEYEPQISTVLMGIDENEDRYLRACHEIALRVKPGMGKKFEEEFYSSPDMRRLRNVYLSELSYMEDVRAANQQHADTQVRLICAGIVFLIVIIFLGLLGTFWFRIRQRVAEIALRKTCGATSSDIFRRTISEGMLLLTIASIPAIAFDIFIHTKLVSIGYSVSEYAWLSLIAFCATTVLMTLMIIAGIAFPARKAMEIEPALALKEE